MSIHPEIADVLAGRRRWCVPVGDCRAVLASIPDGSARCCVTSPPYWGLRDYGIDGQLGLEATPEQYVANMVDVFREVRRVLADDGTLWLNLGDSYAGSGKGGNPPDSPHQKQATNRGSIVGQTARDAARTMLAGMDRCVGFKPKDLVGIPWRVAFALQAQEYQGEIKRELDRIWLAAMIDAEGCIFIHKRKAGQSNGQGYERKSDSYGSGLEVANTCEAVVRRCMEIVGKGSICHQDGFGRKKRIFRWNLRSNESRNVLCEVYPYLVAKQHEARLSIGCPSSGVDAEKAHASLIALHNGHAPTIDFAAPAPMFRPGWYLRQDVIWQKPNPMPESVTDRCTKAHEYVFLLAKAERYFYDAEAIAEKMVSSDMRPPNGAGQGTMPGERPSSGTRLRMPPIGGVKHADAVGGTYSGEEREWPDKRNARSVWSISPKPFHEAHFATMPEALADRCVRAGSEVGDLVIDPFGGAGTTGLVSIKHGRRYVGPELNPEYAAIASRRITEADTHLFTPQAAGVQA